MKKILSIAIFALLALVSCKKEEFKPIEQAEQTEQQAEQTEQKVEALVTLNLNISGKADYNGTATKAIKQGWENGDNIYLFFSYEYEDFEYWIPTTIYKEAVITYNGSSWVVADDASQEALNSLGDNDVSFGSIYALYIAGERRELEEREPQEGKPVYSFGVVETFGDIYPEVQEAEQTYYLLEDNTITATLDFAQLCTQVVITNIDAIDEWRIDSPIEAEYTHFKSILELGVEGNNNKLLTLSENYYACGISNADGTAFYLAEITDADNPVCIILENTTNDRNYYKLFPAGRSFELGKAYKLTGPVLDESGDFISDNGWNYYIENNKIIYTKTDPSAYFALYGSFLDLFGAEKNEFSYYTDAGYGELIFNGNVTKIGKQAFANKPALKSIILPNSVSSIGDYAFSDCVNLISINIPKNVMTIGEEAFNNCSNIRSLTLPNSISSIGESAFFDCSSLISINIPTSLTAIAKNTFQNCSSLQSIDIPNGVTSIGVSAFSNCSSLQNITLPATITSIGSTAFSECISLNSIDIPNGVTSIESTTFFGCSDLTNITIPNSVTNIGNGAFYSCSALTNITIPNSVTNIGDVAFYKCSALASINLPYGLSTIESRTFMHCIKLTNITIPSSVKAIEDSAFLYCPLKIVYCKATTPPTLGDNAFLKHFSGTTSFATLYVPTASVSLYQASDWSNYFIDIVGMDFD